jgi:cytochrome d ubiquinol oxidase subunit I
LRTADAASPIPAGSVAAFIVLFILVCGVVFGSGIYYLRRLIADGPADSYSSEPEALVNRPLSAALSLGTSARVAPVAATAQRVE